MNRTSRKAFINRSIALLIVAFAIDGCIINDIDTNEYLDDIYDDRYYLLKSDTCENINSWDV